MYSAASRTFQFYQGKQLKYKEGEPGGSSGDVRLKVRYPPTIYLAENSTHPEVFSANGSHGTWAAEGMVK